MSFLESHSNRRGDRTEDVIARLNGLLRDSGAPGAAVAAIVDGDLVLATGLGSVDLAGKTPLPGDAHFYIYSVTKTLIATAVLRLVERSRVALDEPVTTYLCELDLPADVTIRRVLNHSAGIPDYGGMPEYSADLRANPSRPWTPDEFLERTLRNGLAYEPGQGWGYSNIGYMMLKQLLERVQGQSLRAIFQEELFAPLELRDTFVAENLADAAVLTPGFTTFFAENRDEATLADMSRVYHPGWVSHGVVISTARELATVIDAVFVGQFFDARLLAEMTEPVLVPVEEHPVFKQPAYGLGLMLDASTSATGGLVAGHGGGGPGYVTGALHRTNDAGERVTSVALVNRDAGEIGLLLASELASNLMSGTP